MAKLRGFNSIEGGAEGGEGGGEGAEKGEKSDRDAWWMGAAFELRRPTPTKIQNMFGALSDNSDDDCGEVECAPCGVGYAWGWAASPGPSTNMAQQVSTPSLDARIFPLLVPGYKPKSRLGTTMKKKYRRGKRIAYLPLNILTRDVAAQDEKALNALGRQTPGARLVEAVVDSGAVDPVAPKDLFDGELEPSEMSKKGKKYCGPDGARIENYGQMNVGFTSDEGAKCGLRWQIADVERPLIAVSYLTAGGNEVIFEKDGGRVVHKETGRSIKIQRKGGVYVMRMWVPPRRETSQGGGRGASDFPRQWSI